MKSTATDKVNDLLQQYKADVDFCSKRNDSSFYLKYCGVIDVDETYFEERLRQIIKEEYGFADDCISLVMKESKAHCQTFSDMFRHILYVADFADSILETQK